MQIKKSVVCIIMLLVAIGIMVSGCANHAFQTARQLDTIQAYDDFLKQYPKNQHAVDAKSRKEDLLCQQIVQKDEIDPYQQYLKMYPQGKCAAEVRQKLEKLVWNNAKQSNMVAAYEDYLKQYPKGVYVEEAKKQKEAPLCVETLKGDNIPDYQTYLASYPQGKCVAEIRQKLEVMLWNKAEQSHALGAYEEYLKQFPQGSHVGAAKIQMEEPLWIKAEKDNTLASYDQYLQLYPGGAHVAKAKEKRKEAETSSLIADLGDSNKEKREAATKKLSGMGAGLSEFHIQKLTEIMRSGKLEWDEYLYRQGHCSWYEKVGVKYYAANVLTSIKSPYVTQEIIKESQVAKKTGKGNKYKVTDPGWV